MSDFIDEFTIRKFPTLLHSRAAVALSHVRRPGVLQLVSIAPDDRGMTVSPFAIGDIDSMLEAAVIDARAGRNVYVEARTVRPGRPTERGRGKLESTIGCFALVIDRDADTGKAGYINGNDTTVIETSPGNSHEWLFLHRALDAGDARPLGERIRKAIGADHDTGVVTQPYRVPGTPNFPDAKKASRGRVVVPTKLVRVSDRLWTPSEIEAVFSTAETQADKVQPRRKAAGAFKQNGPRPEIDRSYAKAQAADDKAADAIEKEPARPHTLTEVRAVFQRWFGAEYDLGVLDAVLAVVAAEKLSGDPPWLLIVGGPGNAKTETIQAASGLNARVVSTITSEGALLSATPRKGRPETATGGLLRQIGDRGILAVKDFTSIISANREVRMQVLAALREIYDGHWIRNVGSDGGQSLEWCGRLIVIGACTTAWDQAHAVVSIMGDRFVLVRADSTTGRIAAGIQAIRNTGTETTMRRELAEAVAGLISQVPPDCPCDLSDKEIDSILTAADIVTMARTAVETDYRGNIIDAHAPEMPTRFAKQLTQVMRGGVAIGMLRTEAMALSDPLCP
jgi:hypothetical protein